MLEHSVTLLQLVSEMSPARHRTARAWRLMLWTCASAAGAVLLFTELMSGTTAVTLVAIVGLLTFIVFGDHLMQKSKAPGTRLPISLVRSFATFQPRSSRFRKMSRFNCFTKDERISWLKNEPNFTKRIATPLELTSNRAPVQRKR